MVILCLIFWGTVILFYSDYIILHSHQQYTRVLIFSHSRLVVVFFLLLCDSSHPMNVKCYLAMVLICIPLVEKAMAPYSSTLAWKNPMDGGAWLAAVQGSLRVGHNWEIPLSLFTFMYWRRKWQPTPLFLPGESQGRGSLVGCHLWGRKESDKTEAT